VQYSRDTADRAARAVPQDRAHGLLLLACRGRLQPSDLPRRGPRL